MKSQKAIGVTFADTKGTLKVYVCRVSACHVKTVKSGGKAIRENCQCKYGKDGRQESADQTLSSFTRKGKKRPLGEKKGLVECVVRTNGQR